MFGLPRTRSCPPYRPGCTSSSRDVRHCIAERVRYVSSQLVIDERVQYLLLTPARYASAPSKDQTRKMALTCTASTRSLSAASAPGPYPQACPRINIQPNPATPLSTVHRPAGVRHIAAASSSETSLSLPTLKINAYHFLCPDQLISR
jgi:hypothetical protein